jgi:hypothetical protein
MTKGSGFAQVDRFLIVCWSLGLENKRPKNVQSTKTQH